MELFENEAACQTPLDRQYHLDVKALKKSRGRRNRRIFTYTDHDRHTNSLPLNQMASSPNNLPVSRLFMNATYKLKISHFPPISAVLIPITEHQQNMAHVPGWKDERPETQRPRPPKDVCDIQSPCN